MIIFSSRERKYTLFSIYHIILGVTMQLSS